MKWEILIRCNDADFARIERRGRDFKEEFLISSDDAVVDNRQQAKLFNSIKLYLSAHEKTCRDWLLVNDPERGKSQKVPSQNLH